MILRSEIYTGTWFNKQLTFRNSTFPHTYFVMYVCSLRFQNYCYRICSNIPVDVSVKYTYVTHYPHETLPFSMCRCPKLALQCINNESEPAALDNEYFVCIIPLTLNWPIIVLLYVPTPTFFFFRPRKFFLSQKFLLAEKRKVS